MDLIVISARPDYWPRFATFFEERGIVVHEADHPDHIAEVLREHPQGDFSLIIMDLPHSFESVRDYAAQAQALRPGLTVGAAHALPDHVFTQAAAGLRLFPLPRNPRERDLEKLIGISRLPAPAQFS